MGLIDSAPGLYHPRTVPAPVMVGTVTTTTHPVVRVTAMRTWRTHGMGTMHCDRTPRRESGVRAGTRISGSAPSMDRYAGPGSAQRARESSAICAGKKRKRTERRESGNGKLRRRRRHSLLMADEPTAKYLTLTGCLPPGERKRTASPDTPPTPPG